MHHSIPLITTLATALGLALILGYIATRLKLPTIVGYLLAGIIIGPFTPGFVADAKITKELSEIAVMLLMFGVGLHLSLEDLLEVRKIALPGAILQMMVATILGVIAAMSWGWDFGGALLFGLALSVASTVVLLRALEAHNMLTSLDGRIAVGWLIVEDMAMVLVLVLLPALAGWLGTTPMHGENLWQVLGLTVLKVSAFIILMMVIGRKIFPKLLWAVADRGSRELFTLCIVAAAISIAYLASTLFGVSFALGAFFAGMTMRESPLSHRAAEESLPLREAFAVLFFVSVGMLFDPMVLINQPLNIIIVAAIIIFGKTIAAAGLVLLFRYPISTAVTVSISLAQIGEFSFILAAMGVELGLLPPIGQGLILAGAFISIAINPLLFRAVQPFQAWLTNWSSADKIEQASAGINNLNMAAEKQHLSNHVVLVGHGRVGRRVAETLAKHNIPYVVIEGSRAIVNELRAQNVKVVYGDATKLEILMKAYVANANMLIIAIADVFNKSQMIKTANTLNPKIQVLVRTHSEEEADLLKQQSVYKVFLGENELAQNMSDHILKIYSSS